MPSPRLEQDSRFLVIPGEPGKFGRRFVAGEIPREVELEVIAEVEQLDHRAVVDRDAVFTPVFLGKHLFFAMIYYMDILSHNYRYYITV